MGCNGLLLSIENHFKRIKMAEECIHFLNGKMFVVQFVGLWLISFCAIGADPIDSDKCVYEFDTLKNVIHVICGKNMQLSVKQKNGEVYVAGLPVAVTEEPELVSTSLNDSKKHGELYDNPMEKITNASHILRRLKKKLNTHSDRLSNITDLLQRGDRALRKDLLKVRQLDPNSATARETMIAAIQNQYNFLRMGLLSQNAEFRQLVFDILTLVSATEKMVRGTLGMEYHLDIKIEQLNETVLESLSGGWGTDRQKTGKIRSYRFRIYDVKKVMFCSFGALHTEKLFYVISHGRVYRTELYGIYVV